MFIRMELTLDRSSGDFKIAEGGEAGAANALFPLTAVGPPRRALAGIPPRQDALVERSLAHRRNFEAT